MPIIIQPADILRTRRHEPTRLENFVDAAFAFAVTLLVISIGHVPNTVAEMLRALRGLPTFAVTFLLITRIWNAHRNWSRYYGLDDAVTVRLSLALVFVVLIFVYPLRLLFALFFASVSGGFLMDQPVELQSPIDMRWIYQIYGLGFGCIESIFLLLYRHALRKSEVIGLNAAEILATRLHVRIWTVIGTLAILSVAAATVLPFSPDTPWSFSIPGLIYCAIFLAVPLLRRRYTRLIASLPSLCSSPDR